MFEPVSKAVAPLFDAFGNTDAEADAVRERAEALVALTREETAFTV